MTGRSPGTCTAPALTGRARGHFDDPDEAWWHETVGRTPKIIMPTVRFVIAVNLIGRSARIRTQRRGGVEDPANQPPGDVARLAFAAAGRPGVGGGDVNRAGRGRVRRMGRPTGTAVAAGGQASGATLGLGPGESLGELGHPVDFTDKVVVLNPGHGASACKGHLGGNFDSECMRTALYLELS